MSAGDQAAAAIAAQLLLAGDGACLGLALGYVAVRSLTKFAATSSAFRKIREAPSVQVSDLRYLIKDDSDEGERNSEVLVVVRGLVASKSAVNGSWKSFWPDVLVSHESGDRGVVLQRSQKCIYNEWRGFFGWYPDLRAVLAKAWREPGTTSTRTIPFVLVDGRQQSHSDYVVVDLDDSNHPLPLTTVYHHIEPIQASPYTFLQALFGHEYPVGVHDEEKILPLGKEVTAVGVCSSKSGALEIKSCRDLPCFLSELTKDQILVQLSFRTKILLWSGIVIGSVSIGVLGYAIVRNWNKWKQWREQRRAQQQNHPGVAAESGSGSPESEVEDEEVGDVPDGQLCVICLMRRRRSAFVPCGHLVCCQRCAFSVERDLAPKCPVCRQVIRGSVRIYDT
ncbi:E3 ubiquitin-protein ligase SPL2-like [Chenopodium quinoa]|uniref:E3 ubiquitin-protein ligase SPL2-like n=1 Tax=Chenopodium quinoa TaxID=63459 RepID=UPI000B76F2A6|nr:E3 ubiquitin-protein ligase SPL2-like [Chenopodium quinoa]